MGAYTSDNALHEKVVWQANAKRLSAENFDRKNADKLIKNLSNSSIFSPIKNLHHTVRMSK